MKVLMLIMATMFVSACASTDQPVHYSFVVDKEYGMQEREVRRLSNHYREIINFENSVRDSVVTNSEFQSRMNDVVVKFSSQKKKILAESLMKDREGFEFGLSIMLIQDAVLDEVVELNERYFNIDNYAATEMFYYSSVSRYVDEKWNNDADATIDLFCDEMVSFGIASPIASGSDELCSPEYINRTDAKMKLKAASALLKMKIRYLGGTMEEGEYFDHEEEFQKVLKDDVVAALNK